MFQLKVKIGLYLFFIFNVYEYFVSMHVYASCICLVLTEARKGYQIPWNWSLQRHYVGAWNQT